MSGKRLEDPNEEKILLLLKVIAGFKIRKALFTLVFMHLIQYYRCKENKNKCVRVGLASVLQCVSRKK